MLPVRWIATDETGIDPAGNVLTVKNSGGSTLESYSYDGRGFRMTNTVGSTTTNLFNSTAEQELEEQAASSGYYTARYVWSVIYVNQMIDRDTDTSGTGLTATGSGFARAWPLADADFNTVALVVMSGGSATAVERYAYDPFGAVTYMDGSYTVLSASAYAWVYLFQGGKLDGVTSDTHFGARDVNSGLGVWNRQDPLGFGGGDQDLYRCENNAPTDSVDPTGRDAVLLYAPNVAAGQGHFAVLVGTDSSGWTYYSFAPNSIIDTIFGGSNPKPSVQGVPMAGSFQTIINNAPTSILNHYTHYVYYTTTDDQTNAAHTAAQTWVNTAYSFQYNCVNHSTSVLQAAGISVPVYRVDSGHSTGTYIINLIFLTGDDSALVEPSDSYWGRVPSPKNTLAVLSTSVQVLPVPGSSEPIPQPGTTTWLGRRWQSAKQTIANGAQAFVNFLGSVPALPPGPKY